jgi:hypothetical protein
MDTNMLETYEPLNSQRKILMEQANGSRKKAKAHRTLPHTSLTTDDVELVATTVEDRLLEVWENVEKHRASIMEKAQEVKTVLEQFWIRVEKPQKDKPTKTREGIPAGETVQITVQGGANFIITPEMLFIDEEVA